MHKKPTTIIAEMACAHEGDPALARKIIDASAQAGADTVQLQIWSLQSMMSPQRKEHAVLKRIELSQKQWTELRDYVRTAHPQLQLYVCVYEHASIDFIHSLDVDGYKLNSSDLSNPLVLDKVARANKPINLSIGASSIPEIQFAIERIRKISDAPITLMYGHQSFPTKPEHVHLSYLAKIKHLFELPVGYQDHCAGDSELGFWLPAASMGLGVSVLEKHITHDRAFKGIDHESALNPDEFTRFVEMVRQVDIAMGLSVPRAFSEDEIRYRQFQKKSIVCLRDLPAGAELASGDLGFMRADTLGLAPDRFEQVLGQTLRRPIKAFEAIEQGDIS
jgi:N,N'-diacetyllegionaminate synthase